MYIKPKQTNLGKINTCSCYRFSFDWNGGLESLFSINFWRPVLSMWVQGNAGKQVHNNYLYVNTNEKKNDPILDIFTNSMSLQAVLETFTTQNLLFNCGV